MLVARQTRVLAWTDFLSNIPVFFQSYNEVKLPEIKSLCTQSV